MITVRNVSVSDESGLIENALSEATSESWGEWQDVNLIDPESQATLFWCVNLFDATL